MWSSASSPRWFFWFCLSSHAYTICINHYLISVSAFSAWPNSISAHWKLQPPPFPLAPSTRRLLSSQHFCPSALLSALIELWHMAKRFKMCATQHQYPLDTHWGNLLWIQVQRDGAGIRQLTLHLLFIRPQQIGIVYVKSICFGHSIYYTHTYLHWCVSLSHFHMQRSAAPVDVLSLVALEPCSCLCVCICIGACMCVSKWYLFAHCWLAPVPDTRPQAETHTPALRRFRQRIHSSFYRFEMRNMTGTEHRAVLAASTALMNGQKRTESRFKKTHSTRLTEWCSEHAQAPSAAKERL